MHHKIWGQSCVLAVYIIYIKYSGLRAEQNMGRNRWMVKDFFSFLPAENKLQVFKMFLHFPCLINNSKGIYPLAGTISFQKLYQKEGLYIYISIYISLSIYIYIYIFVCMCIYIYSIGRHPRYQQRGL